MRLDTSAPGDQVQPPNVHWAQIASDEPIEVHVGTGKPVTEFIRALRDAEVLRRSDPLCAAVLLLMLDLVNFKELHATGRLLCWPSRAYLAWHSNRNPDHVARAIAQLKKLGVLRVAEAGGGIQTTTWELVKPDGPPRAPARGVPARQRAGRERASARGGSAPAHPDPARQRVGSPRASARQKPKEGNRKIETDSLNNTTGSSSSTPPVQEPAPDGRSAAAAAELVNLGIGEETIMELVSLPTTTRAVCIAAGIEAKPKPEEKRTGLIVYLVRKPARISDRCMKQALARLGREADCGRMQHIPELPKDRQEAIAEIRALAQAVKARREGAAQGNA